MPLVKAWSNAARVAGGAFVSLRDRVGRTIGLPPVGPLPSFLIIGAQRAGTTSLYNYLLDHPQIAPAALKEVHFFDVHFAKGTGWYRDQFRALEEHPDEKAITGEASPYYIFHPLAPYRIAELLPNVKIIVLLRNPVDRAISHYHHEVRCGNETLSLAEALAAEEGRLKGEAERIRREPGYRSITHQRHSYRARGCYMDQLETWAKLFPRENILPLLSERFYEAPAIALQQVTDFLGLAPMPERKESFPIHNLASYPELEKEMRDELAAFYKPHNERLAAFLGESPGWD